MAVFITLLVVVVFFLLIRNNELSIDKKVLEKEIGDRPIKTESSTVISEYDNLISNYLEKRADERNLIVVAASKGDKDSEEIDYGCSQIMVALKNKYERVGKKEKD